MIFFQWGTHEPITWCGAVSINRYLQFFWSIVNHLFCSEFSEICTFYNFKWMFLATDIFFYVVNITLTAYGDISHVILLKSVQHSPRCTIKRGIIYVTTSIQGIILAVQSSEWAVPSLVFTSSGSYTDIATWMCPINSCMELSWI